MPRPFGAAARAIEAERAKTRHGTAPPEASNGPYALSFSDPERRGAKIEELYKELLEARMATAEKGGLPSFDEFGKFVREKTQQLKLKQGAAQVEYTVSIEDGRVKLKARISA